MRMCVFIPAAWLVVTKCSRVLIQDRNTKLSNWCRWRTQWSECCELLQVVISYCQYHWWCFNEL